MGRAPPSPQPFGYWLGPTPCPGAVTVPSALSALRRGHPQLRAWQKAVRRSAETRRPRRAQSLLAGTGGRPRGWNPGLSGENTEEDSTAQRINKPWGRARAKAEAPRPLSTLDLRGRPQLCCAEFCALVLMGGGNRRIGICGHPGSYRLRLALHPAIHPTPCPASGRAGLLIHLCTASSEQSPGASPGLPRPASTPQCDLEQRHHP